MSVSPVETHLLFTLILTAVPDKSLAYRELCGHTLLPRGMALRSVSGVALKIPTYQPSRNPQRYMDKNHLERRNDLLCTFNLLVNSHEGCEVKWFANQANKTSVCKF